MAYVPNNLKDLALQLSLLCIVLGQLILLHAMVSELGFLLIFHRYELAPIFALLCLAAIVIGLLRNV